MEDLRIKKIQVERTAPDKRKISLIFSHTAIHYIIDGFGYFNGVRLGPGQGFICAKGTQCTYYPSPSQPWTYVWINVTGSDSASFAERYAQSGYTFCFDSCDEVLTLGTVLENNAWKLCDREYSASAMAILKTYHADCRLYDTAAGTGSQYVSQAIDILSENLHEHITVQQIADRLHISSGYLRYLFSVTQGLPPKSYMTKLRCDRASELLLHTDHPVSQIAASVGCCDSMQLSKLFKKQMGCAPSQYRRMYKKSTADTQG